MIKNQAPSVCAKKKDNWMPESKFKVNFTMLPHFKTSKDEKKDGFPPLATQNF